ncbi:MAG: hypothetical protein ACRCT6_11455 [Notoacmeibacter sp.]
MMTARVSIPCREERLYLARKAFRDGDMTQDQVDFMQRYGDWMDLQGLDQMLQVQKYNAARIAAEVDETPPPRESGLLAWVRDNLGMTLALGFIAGACVAAAVGA